MKEKKGGGETRRRMRKAVRKHEVYATSTCGKRKENSKSVRRYYERGGLSRSLESIDKFGIPKGRRTTIGALR